MNVVEDALAQAGVNSLCLKPTWLHNITMLYANVIRFSQLFYFPITQLEQLCTVTFQRIKHVQ